MSPRADANALPACPPDLVDLAPGFDAAAHWPALYGELRAIAGRLMRSERAEHTLSPTALVHEAWLKLGSGAAADPVVDRGHFLSLAARAMRHILVNHAQARRADKRQGDAVHVTLSLAQGEAVPQSGPEDILALDQALALLASEDPRAAQVAEMKVFGGLLIPEMALALGVSEPTVKRDWMFARARLAQLLA
jgi:RNA polymerase sigma-70 factor, ECF subfamily